MSENLTKNGGAVNWGLSIQSPWDALAALQEYEPAVLLKHPHGFLAGARYDGEVHHERLLAVLGPLERDAAIRAGRAGIGSFVAGRMALRAALSALPEPPPRTVGAIDRDARGAPILPGGYVGSVSHKDGVALALAAVAAGQFVGVDVETDATSVQTLPPYILRDDEGAELHAAGMAPQHTAVRAYLSIKEAVFKAVDSAVQYALEWKEIRVGINLAAAFSRGSGFVGVDVQLHTKRAGANVTVSATLAAHGRQIVATAQAWPR